jgi:two-component system NtrC family response regulator
MENFTKEQLEHIIDCLQRGIPLPGTYRDRIRFDDEHSDAEDSPKKRPAGNLLGLIGSHTKMRDLFEQIRRVAAGDIPILLEGEKGTGKKLAARTIHRLSPRKKDPLVLIDCASNPVLFPDNLCLDADKSPGSDRAGQGGLDGERRGTVVLDRIDELAPELQAKLFQFLDRKNPQDPDGEAHCVAGFGIVATTDADLKQKATDGLFRRDLYQRLSLITLTLPPLRGRGHDISHLADYFLKKYAVKRARKIAGFSAKALEAMMCYHWPENVAELDQRIRRAVLMAPGKKITPQDLGIEDLLKHARYNDLSLKDARLKAERNVIVEALDRNRFSLTKAARSLGISRPTLYGHIEKLGINIEILLPQSRPPTRSRTHVRFAKSRGHRSG